LPTAVTTPTPSQPQSPTCECARTPTPLSRRPVCLTSDFLYYQLYRVVSENGLNARADLRAAVPGGGRLLPRQRPCRGGGPLLPRRPLFFIRDMVHIT
jgi:hypothetical protein